MIKAMFSPKGGISAEIMRTIGAATTSVKVAAFVFTSTYIGKAIKNAIYFKHVKVQMVLEAKVARKKYSIDELLAVYGVDVREIDIPRGVMHNKIVIVDDKKVITGSYNFTNDAENKNYENVIISDIPEFVADFVKEFDKLWAISTVNNASIPGKTINANIY
jgi:phosphatidylserine/phosphatidylglycerophosphate/cardiolipin synthase-like enzyme